MISAYWLLPVALGFWVFGYAIAIVNQIHDERKKEREEKEWRNDAWID